MADIIGELVVQITGDTKGFDKSVDQSKKKMTKFSADLGKFGTNMTKYATLPILAVDAAMVKSAAAVEKQKTAFGVLLKDVKKGNKLFGDLQTLASKTPLQLENITASAQQLLAAGTQLNDINDTITMLGDIALGDAQKLDTMTRAYSKMQTKGKATMEELNMVTEAGVPILQALADHYDTTVEKVFELSSKGKIGFTDVKEAMELLTSETGQFNGGMEKLSQTTAGKFSTAIDNIKISAAEFGATLLPAVNDILEGVTKLFQGFNNLDDGTKEIILTIAGVQAVIGPAIKAFGALKIAVTGAAGPFGAIGLAITAIIVGLKALNDVKLEKMDEQFGEVAKKAQLTAKEVNDITDFTINFIDSELTLSEAVAKTTRQMGVRRDTVLEALLLSKQLTKEEEAQVQAELDSIQKIEALKKKAADSAAEEKRHLEELIVLEKERLETVRQRYVDHADLVQSYLDSEKSRLTVIDEEISKLDELKWAKGSKLEESRQQAVEILTKEKDELLQLEKEKSDEIERINEERKSREALSRVAEVAQVKSTATNILSILSGANQIELNNIEHRKNAKIEALNKEELGEDEYNKRVQEIEKETALNTWKIQKQQLAYSKAAALTEIAYNTAIAVAKVWGQTGVLGFLAQAAPIAMGAVQAGVVLSQPEPPRPQLATGAFISGSPGGTDVTVGEGGDEEIFGMGSKGVPRRRQFALEVAETVANAARSGGDTVARGMNL